VKEYKKDRIEAELYKEEMLQRVENISGSLGELNDNLDAIFNKVYKYSGLEKKELEEKKAQVPKILEAVKKSFISGGQSVESVRKQIAEFAEDIKKELDKGNFSRTFESISSWLKLEHDRKMSKKLPFLKQKLAAGTENDPLLGEALKLKEKYPKITTSLLQRRFSIGYARAARIMDEIEALKAVQE
jgi:DNA segregation ATPase FtsK/SpoIIIE-like protein